MIDAVAREAHFVDNMAPVWAALPEDARGQFVGTTGVARTRIRELGFSPHLAFNGKNAVMVASAGDLLTMRAQRAPKVAMMEHGAGQSYGGRQQSKDHSSYAGGRGRGRVGLFLHPGEHPANRDRRTYPRARVEVVGSPILEILPKREGTPDRVVAVSFHFNAAVCSETRSALPWAFPAVSRLPGQYKVLGHAHPRLYEAVERRYRHVGIEPVKDFFDVCRRADLYVCDNSSSLFMFAATGRPVVVLNPPWYSRKVNHGLRFWEASGVGVNCNDPALLAECIEEALEDTPEQQAKREAALDLVYAYRSGSARRAADALVEWAA
jgi:hypothetical protein